MQPGLGVGDLFRLALASGREDVRRQLIETVLESLDEAFEAIAQRVGGDAVPDTVIARTAVEPVLAAIAYSRVKGARRIRVIASSEPVEGWGPLNTLLEVLAAERIVDVYRVPLQPSTRLHVKEVVRRVARITRGFSARVVDVTDAPAYAVAGLYSAGVRVLTVLVDAGYAALFQKFSFTL
ncbi:hypothetical protein [Hyperthermus butylicus]|uniref:Uncharacterized protein n=1 Tax=Hyperthermus butylicus (strain DSM 5456 / JCM 9403 / PLM1-5) TaxID=415426 RepID=A2BLG6_HYPBU|nr:hypothetical protein [Hyperthermus butylicus]ABM80827.1 hypothetical protein Hbut_0979 [Hyperthermus butylicus DSM 5456]